jgi:hypothetical protein
MRSVLMVAVGALALWAGAAAGAGGKKPARPKLQRFTGKVQPLPAAKGKAGKPGLALVTKDRKVFPLVRDEGSEMFFLDKSLQGREMRLTAVLRPATNALEVVEAHSLIKGQLHEIYYWCDNCLLRYTAPGQCECCGADTKLREVPVNEK